MKEKFKELLLTTERKGIEDLIEWMNKNGFFNAPCSSKYHLAQPGGLAEHSLNVFRAALDLSKALYSDKITFKDINSIIICTLLHDLGKAGQFGKPAYSITNQMSIDFVPGTAATYETNKELLYVPHEVRSIAIASRFIELTEEEQFAILYHNGMYGELKAFKGNETPLLLILHFADMWAARVMEKEETK